MAKIEGVRSDTPLVKQMKISTGYVNMIKLKREKNAVVNVNKAYVVCWEH